MEPTPQSTESDEKNHKAALEAALARSRSGLKHVIGKFIDEADGIELAALAGVIQTFALDRVNKLLTAHGREIISPEHQEGDQHEQNA